MSPLIHDDLVRAIEEIRLIEFEYKDGRRRIVEPHDYGIKNGKEQLLAWRVSASGRGGQEPWRRYDVPAMRHLRVLDQHFAGSRGEEGQRHHQWDVLFARVGRR